MKNLIILALILFTTLGAIGQVFTPRTNGTFTPVDPFLSVPRALYIPKVCDTTGTPLHGGKDSVGAIISDTCNHKLWIRDIVGTVHRWREIGNVSTSLFYYNIIDYGAIGDGLTDNTNAINATIAAAEATKGVVFIPPGVYVVKSVYRDTAIAYRPKGIQLKSNVKIFGAGIGKSIIKLSNPPAGATFNIPDFNVIAYTSNCAFWDVIFGDTVSNVILKDFSINGNVAHQVNYYSNPYHSPQYGWPDSVLISGIRFMGGENNQVINVEVDSCVTYGTAFIGSSNGLISSGKMTTSVQGGVYFYNSEGSILENSFITNNNADNIRIKSSNVKIVNNESSWAKFNPELGFNNFAGIYVEGNPMDITGVQILNNYTHDNSSFGVDIWNGGDTSDVAYPGTSVLVGNNIISYNANGGIELSIPNVSIVNNQIYNNGADSNGVSDPQFYRPYGVNLNNIFTTNLKNVLISGNFFRDTRGFQLYALGNGGAGTPVESLTFSNNTITGGQLFQTGTVSSVAPFTTIVGNTYKTATESQSHSQLNAGLTLNGNLGIGINPLYKLHILGNTISAPTALIGNIVLQSYGNTNGFFGMNIYYDDLAGSFKYIQTGEAQVLQFVNGGLYFSSAPSGTGGTNATPSVKTSIDGNGNVTFGATNSIVGTATNNNAVTGNIGEYVESNISSGSAVSLTTNTAANVTSISLTAGDWDVEGIVNFTTSGASTSNFKSGSNSTSATFGGDNTWAYLLFGATGLTDQLSEIIPTRRFSLASTTTIYLVTEANFSLGSVSAFGLIRARRVR